MIFRRLASTVIEILGLCGFYRLIRRRTFLFFFQPANTIFGLFCFLVLSFFFPSFLSSSPSNVVYLLVEAGTLMRLKPARSAARVSPRPVSLLRENVCIARPFERSRKVRDHRPSFAQVGAKFFFPSFFPIFSSHNTVA